MRDLIIPKSGQNLKEEWKQKFSCFGHRSCSFNTLLHKELSTNESSFCSWVLSAKSSGVKPVLPITAYSPPETGSGVCHIFHTYLLNESMSINKAEQASV